jgi:methyl-accepting chemotaxis protein
MSWKDMKIAKKLYIGFGTTMTLALVIGIMAYNGIGSVSGAADEANLCSNIAQSTLNNQVMAKQFRIKANEKLLPEIDKETAATAKTLLAWRSMTNDGKDKNSIQQIDDLVRSWKSTFDEYIGLRKEMGFTEKDGLQGKLRNAVRACEARIKETKRDDLLVQTLMCRRHEKDFMLRLDTKYVDELKTSVATLQLLLKGTSSAAELSGLLQTYEQSFIEYAATQSKITVLFSKLDGIYQSAEEQIKGAVARNDSDRATASSRTKNVVMVLVIFSLIAGGLISFVIARAVSRPITAIAKIADDISMGDIQHNIDFQSQDETGKLADSFRGLIDYMKSLADAAERIAANDLTVTVEPKSSKDVLGNSFKTMVTNLTGVIRQLTDNSTQLVSAATEIASSSEKMARGSQEQTGQTVQVSSAVEEMTATIVESSKNAVEAANQAKEAANAARTGNLVVSQTIEGMNRIARVVQDSANTVQELAKSSDKIGEIIGVIDDIADQTNLLALNAAIEAARAGEQGRGFAVVADEVRKLAERTGKATKEITDMIKGIQNDTKGAVTSMEQGISEVQQGRDLADKAGESLNQIAGFAQKVMDMVQQIATAAEQQSAASEQIARSVEGIARVTKENAAGVEQSATAAEELNRQAEGMQKMVSSFKTNA